MLGSAYTTCGVRYSLRVVTATGMRTCDHCDAPTIGYKSGGLDVICMSCKKRYDASEDPDIRTDCDDEPVYVHPPEMAAFLARMRIMLGVI